MSNIKTQIMNIRRELNEEMKAACVIKDVIGKPYRIVCIKAYEFEGRQFREGEISYHSWGRPIPNNWRKAISKDIENYFIYF